MVSTGHLACATQHGVQCVGNCGALPLTWRTACACSLEYIVDDELVEVTPVSVRIRKNPDAKTKKKRQ
jgi:predicted membrane GTPase involved in stress response